MRKFSFTSLLLTGLLIASSLSAHTQTTNTPTDSLRQEIRGMIRHSLVHWLDPIMPSAQFGVDYRIGYRQYLRHDVGYIFDIGYDEPIALEGISGLRFRTAYRKYYQAAWLKRRLTYLEFNLDYRYLDASIAGDFWRDNFSYQQRINYSMWQHSISANIQFGISRTISDQWRFDLGIGAGIRLNHRTFSDVPDDARFSTDGEIWVWDYGVREDFSFGLSMPLVIAIGYQW